MAKSLLEQVALVSQGREVLYEKILLCVQAYVRDDLTKFNDLEPAQLISKRPCDDPLEQILCKLYLCSESVQHVLLLLVISFTLTSIIISFRFDQCG